MMSKPNDLERMRRIYAERKRGDLDCKRYSRSNPANLFIFQQRQRQALKLLNNAGVDLSACDILELGCGGGAVSLEFLSYGIDPARLHGVDYLFESLQTAKRKLSGSALVCANGEYLPYPKAAFDLIMQFTAFSSILDQEIRNHVASEMLRLLRPNGLILWYDFWLNPTNPQTRGIRPGEIRKLFPDCRYFFRKITLAPPIARLVVPISWPLAYFLESLKVFNSHYLVAIQPLGKGQE